MTKRDSFSFVKLPPNANKARRKAPSAGECSRLPAPRTTAGAMGDFGPAYMSSSRPTAQLYRCDDCSVTMPAAAASDDALCPSCGGTLRSLGVGGAAPPDASARTGVRGTGVSAAEMASVVLSEILSPGLLESLGACLLYTSPSPRDS